MNLWNKFNADVEAARDLLIVTKTALKLGEKPINGEGNVADIGTNELKHGIIEFANFPFCIQNFSFG